MAAAKKTRGRVWENQGTLLLQQKWGGGGGGGKKKIEFNLLC